MTFCYGNVLLYTQVLPENVQEPAALDDIHNTL